MYLRNNIVYNFYLLTKIIGAAEKLHEKNARQPTSRTCCTAYYTTFRTVFPHKCNGLRKIYFLRLIMLYDGSRRKIKYFKLTAMRICAIMKNTDTDATDICDFDRIHI